MDVASLREACGRPRHNMMHEGIFMQTPMPNLPVVRSNVPAVDHSLAQYFGIFAKDTQYIDNDE